MPPANPSTPAPWEGLIFEPHSCFGSVADPYGEPWPFGYISTATPMPVFELNVPLEWPAEALTSLAIQMAAAPTLAARVAELEGALERAAKVVAILLGDDERFSIMIGGNPNAVVLMIADARKAADAIASTLSRKTGEAESSADGGQ